MTRREFFTVLAAGLLATQARLHGAPVAAPRYVYERWESPNGVSYCVWGRVVNGQTDPKHWAAMRTAFQRDGMRCVNIWVE